MGVVFDLADQKIGYIGTGNEAIPPFLAIDQHFVTAAVGSVGQNDRSYDDPVEIAVSNELFLNVLVGVGASQKHAKTKTLQTAKLSPTVTCAKSGDANQPLHAGGLHCWYESTGGLREQADRSDHKFRSSSNAKRLYDNVDPVERGRHIMRVKGIALALLEIGINYSDPLGAPG